MTVSDPPVDALHALSALPFSVFVLDGDCRIGYVNGAAEQFFGRSANGLAGRRLDALFPESSPLFTLILQAVAGRTSVSECDVAMACPDGGERQLALTVSPMAEEGGMAVVSLQEQSIARRIQTIRRGAARSVAGLASLLAHEVKNPLSGIRGAAQLLEETLDDEEDRSLTRMICEETDRICALVDRMGPFSERPRPRTAVNIHRVLERVRRVAEAGFGRRARFVEEYDPSLPAVCGDGDQLIQVFLNVVKNACEAAAPRRPEITLKTAYRGSIRLTLPGGARRVQLPLEVSVADNGGGVPEDIAAHVFDPFVTSKPAGSGLGLALVAKVVGDHGGIVEFDTGSEGSEFRIRLPVYAEGEGAP